VGLIVAKIIDHTLLKAEATPGQIYSLCEEALKYNFASVCVNPCYVRDAVHHLSGSTIKTCCVIGFPLGANDTSTKVLEAADAIEFGALEIDMVINVGSLKYKASGYVGEEIRAVREVVPASRILKVIIESAALTNEEIRSAAILSINNGADFVKTSTGFHPSGGAKVEHVRLIKSIVGDKAQIKASGGIKTYADVLKFVEAGASRIGTSSGVSIVKEVMDCEKHP
jgi:deoxyribose-phosphate aldolase